MPLRPNVRALLLLDEKGVVPSMPPDAFVKFEVVVKEEEEGLDRDDRAGSHGLLLRDCAGRHRWERAPTFRRRRHLPLRRARDAQRRLLGGREVA